MLHLKTNKNNWRSGYEEVGVGDTDNFEQELFAPDSQKEEYVRFKVFR